MLQDTHIIVIDDTESIREFLAASLEAHGATVTTTATASGGLSLCEQRSPDLVILDLGLPDNDGLNILQRIKKTHKESPPIVLVLTVRKEQHYVDRAKEIGADYYLTKPIRAEDLVEAVSNLLGKRKSAIISA